MPLFVKLPGQHRGRIDDSFVQTIDVLPTIAAALHTKLPWPVDGKPLIGRKLPRDGTVRIATSSGGAVTSDLRALLARRRRALADQIATFGTGALARVYRIGPHRELLGRSVSSLGIRPSANESVHVSGRELLERRRPGARSRPDLRDRARSAARIPRSRISRSASTGRSRPSRAATPTRARRSSAR